MANQEATIPQESFYKSLAKLEAMSKVSKSQICTGPNSETKTWPGGELSDLAQDGLGEDKIKEDGTDYNERGSKEARKSIRDKVKKGQALTAAELQILKSDIDAAEKALPMGGKPPVMGAGAAPMGKAADDKDDKKEDKEEEKDELLKLKMKKSLEQNETLQKGIEVSEFLSEFANAFSKGLQGIEARTQEMIKSLAEQLQGTFVSFATDQGEFNKSLAEAVANIGYGVAGSIAQVEQVAQMPAGAPRSQMQAAQGQQGYINKSFAGPNGGEAMNKSQMLDIMQTMLEKGEVSPLDIVKFDTTGEINPHLSQKVMMKARQS